MPQPTPDPDPSASPSRLARLPGRVHGKLAALGLVGAVMVTLPVVQLLRYQKAELDALAAGRAGLNPVARAVHVQRGLLAHRDVAGLVLRGQAELEPERLARQTQVDDRLVGLTAALAGGPWPLALGESDALRQDWQSLAGQVVARSVDAPQSDQAHRLLVEQTLQVMDLLAESDNGRAEAGQAALQAGIRGLGLALLPLALVALMLGASLWRDLRRLLGAAHRHAEAAAAPPQAAGQAGGRAETGALLDRLRDGQGQGQGQAPTTTTPAKPATIRHSTTSPSPGPELP